MKLSFLPFSIAVCAILSRPSVVIADGDGDGDDGNGNGNGDGNEAPLKTMCNLELTSSVFDNPDPSQIDVPSQEALEEIGLDVVMAFQEAYNPDHLPDLEGKVAIGHLAYFSMNKTESDDDEDFYDEDYDEDETGGDRAVARRSLSLSSQKSKNIGRKCRRKCKKILKTHDCKFCENYKDSLMFVLFDSDPNPWTGLYDNDNNPWEFMTTPVPPGVRSPNGHGLRRAADNGNDNHNDNHNGNHRTVDAVRAAYHNAADAPNTGASLSVSHPKHKEWERLVCEYARSNPAFATMHDCALVVKDCKIVPAMVTMLGKNEKHATKYAAITSSTSAGSSYVVRDHRQESHGLGPNESIYSIEAAAI